MPAWAEQESLVKGAQVIKFKGQWKKAFYNQPIAILLSDAPMSLPDKTAKKGQVRATTPCNFILSKNILKTICLLSSHFGLYHFLCPSLLYPPSGLQSISWSSYLLLYLYHLFPLSFLIFIILFRFLLSLSPFPLSLTLFCLKIFWRLSVCFLFTSDSTIFSAHPCSINIPFLSSLILSNFLSYLYQLFHFLFLFYF